jgi:type IV pilus assembly protein PilV
MKPRQPAPGARVARAASLAQSAHSAHSAHSAPAPRASQAGVSLVDVLVALLVVSLGLLAMAGLLGTTSRFSKTGEFRSTASLLAQDITDRLRANLSGARDGRYNLVTSELASARPDSAAACAVADACTPAELAAIDLAEWQATLYNSLPRGTGHLQFNGETADLWIIWQDPSTLDDDADKTRFLTGADGKSACPPGFSLADPIPSCMYFRVAR